MDNDSFLATAASKAYSDIDFPMIRLGEIYLIYAEACMNLGQANTAMPKLRELSERAGVQAPTSMADYLLEERPRADVEGHRRTDLIRYGKFTSSSFLWTYKGGLVQRPGLRRPHEDLRHPGIRAGPPTPSCTRTPDTVPAPPPKNNQ